MSNYRKNVQLNEIELQLLRKQIASKNQSYNSTIQMLRSPFSSPGYHTTIKAADTIHSTLHTLVYALGLLDTEQHEDGIRAFDIIAKVISLQDTNRSNSTFGIWSWFYEEPLEQMSPPDWNWADFCGKLLVLALSRHGSRFPEELYQDVKQAIYNACDAIIKRDVGPGYTNIAIMGAFVTLIAGELFEEQEYAAYGLRRLEKLYQFSQIRNAFQEYNSPPYAVVAITELSKLNSETKNERAKHFSTELLKLAWGMVAEHYHAGTNQWSGPHSRCYSTMLSEQHQAFLQYATAGKLQFFDWSDIPYSAEWYKSGISCPEALSDRMLQVKEGQLEQAYAVDDRDQFEKRATTYLTEAYSIGSFNREIMWNQTRTLLGYMGNGDQTTYLHLRCLHDGYDYCSAIFNGAQHKGHVLYGIYFITNGGDTHPNLDFIDGTIQAADFRLRLELGGSLDDVHLSSDQQEATIRIGDREIRVQHWFSTFDPDPTGNAENDEENQQQHGRQSSQGSQGGQGWEINEEGDVLGLDWVLYAGERRTIDFRSMSQAALSFSLTIDGQDQHFTPEVALTDNQVTLSGAWEGEQLELTLPLKPVER